MKDKFNALPVKDPKLNVAHRPSPAIHVEALAINPSNQDQSKLKVSVKNVEVKERKLKNFAIPVKE